MNTTPRSTSGAGNLSFRIATNDALWPNGNSQTVSQDIRPFDPGPHHYRLEVTASQAVWTARNTTTNRVVTTTLAMPSSFNMSEVTGFHFYVSETTGSGTWGDYLTIACQ